VGGWIFSSDKGGLGKILTKQAAVEARVGRRGIVGSQSLADVTTTR
jgi:hypothetical protein